MLRNYVINVLFNTKLSFVSGVDLFVCISKMIAMVTVSGI